MEKKCRGQVHGVTCSPLSPGIPGMPRGPTIAGPVGPLSPYNKYSIRHIWWTNHGSLCIWISVSSSAIQEQHCTAADSAAPNQYKTYYRKEIDQIELYFMWWKTDSVMNLSNYLTNHSEKNRVNGLNHGLNWWQLSSSVNRLWLLTCSLNHRLLHKMSPELLCFFYVENSYL